jgi:hypothetical protein
MGGMGQDSRQTVDEIERTRDELAQKVDELMGRARVEAVEAGKKLGVVAAAGVGLLLVGWFAKRRVGK